MDLIATLGRTLGFSSLGEDAFVVGLASLAPQYLVAALIVCAVALVLILVFATLIVSTVCHWFRRGSRAVRPQ